ncbi:MAG TPA: Crp/Fnr family transcriptional regulator [Candidatus Acidoferrum sp.]|jgi:CRP/FNR family transcriptional regulator
MSSRAMVSSSFSHLGTSHSLLRKTPSPYGLAAPETCLGCQLGNTEFFCKLSESSKKALDLIKHVSSYPERSIIFMEGEEARGVYILCQGRAKLLTTNGEGKTLILKIARPGEVLGLNSLLTNRPHDITVETLQPCQLAFVSRQEFMRYIREHSDACFHVAQHAGRDCHSAYESVRSIGLSSSASEKLARFLVDWSADGKITEGILRVKLALTHEEIAQLIGSSRETVSRTLSEFKRQNLLELNGSTMLLRNKAALQNMAGI